MAIEREKILDAALALINEVGLDQFTTRKLACTTGTITSCAIRSMGCTVKATLPRFQQLTISGPW